MPDDDVILPEIPKSLSEQLTELFYQWEKRGRGWQVCGYPVELEPPFEPFFLQDFLPQQVIDDARQPPSRIALFLEKIFPRLIKQDQDYQEVQSLVLSSPSLPFPPEPDEFYDDSELIELQIILPPNKEISEEASEQFLLGLKYSRPLSFEIIGLPDSISIQFTCREKDSQKLREQLKGYFPEAVITEEQRFLRNLWDDIKKSVIIDFGLSQEFMLPIRTYRNFKTDPFIGIAGALAGLQQGELGLFQVLFQATQNPWVDNILRAVLGWDGKGFFMDAPQMVPFSKQKISRPLLAAVVRIAAQSEYDERAWEIIKGLSGTLTQYADPSSNELLPLNNDDYDDYDHQFDILERRSHRTGMILNSEELVSLVHLPSASVRIEKLQREIKKTKEAPSVVSNHQLTLGENIHAGTTKPVTLSPDQRIRHTYIIGASGSGKSTLILNMIIQDIQNGQGFGVLDPHGDLIDQILGYIPEERYSDVILVDPSDQDYPIGFNILQSRSEIEKNLLASDLVSVFKRLSTSWGDQMTSVLGNAILAFLESEKGGTLADLRRFLVEKDYRHEFFETVTDQEVVYYWLKEFPLLTSKPQASILTRLDNFLRPKLIRHMISQKENKIDFEKIMDGQKIFLAKLAQGAIGEENAYLLGTLFVSAIHQITLSRQQIKESERKNFYLYIDEFQNFITPSMAAVLSGARKYHLGLVLAHQDLQQLWEKDKGVANAVISNPCTRICFRLGDLDARKLEEGFSFFEAKDLQNLCVGEAIAKVEKPEYDFNLKTLSPPEVVLALAEKRKAEIVKLSRQKYGLKREEVEKILAESRKPSLVSRALEKVKTPFKKDEKEPKLTKDEQRLMAAVSDKPSQDKEDLAKDLNLPDEKIQNLLETLKKRKLVDVVSDKESKETAAILTKKGAKEAGLPPPLGKGGAQHKYLQQLLKRFAEDRGYRATIEKQVEGGWIDLALEKSGRKIACEITLSTTAEQELGNIEKCLAAGFDQVILLSPEKKTLNKAKELVSKKLSASDQEKISFFIPEEFVSFFEKEETEALSKEETIRGYKVKVNYMPVSEDEKKAKQEAISKVILQAMKRLKGKE